MSWLKSIFCEHEWEYYGSGYDDFVRCKKCGKIKDREPGDTFPW